MGANTSISVIVRTINRRDLLREALESLARQSLQSFEVVIVDMSGGRSTQVVTDYTRQLPQITHLQIGKPLPRAGALNRGIQHAAADKIAILDDDNLYDPTHLEILATGLEQTGADLVYTGVRRTTYTPMGELIDMAVWHDSFDFVRLLSGNYIHTSGTAFWKRTWERVGGYDLRFPVYEDHDFLIRVAEKGRIERLPSITAESRSFTAHPGMQNHVLEIEHVRRSRVGIRWVHRNLFSSEKFRAHAHNSKAELVRRGNFVSKMKRSLSPSMLRDLIGWWWFSKKLALRRTKTKA